MLTTLVHVCTLCTAACFWKSRISNVWMTSNQCWSQFCITMQITSTNWCSKCHFFLYYKRFHLDFSQIINLQVRITLIRLFFRNSQSFVCLKSLCIYKSVIVLFSFQMFIYFIQSMRFWTSYIMFLNVVMLFNF